MKQSTALQLEGRQVYTQHHSRYVEAANEQMPSQIANKMVGVHDKSVRISGSGTHLNAAKHPPEGEPEISLVTRPTKEAT